MVAFTPASPICVTGLAWTTALGDSLPAVWERLLAGETGLAALPCTYRLRNELVAVAQKPELSSGAGERLRLMAHDTILRALADAGLSPDDPQLHLVLGTSFGAHLDEAGPSNNSLYAWAEEVARALRIATPPISVSTACSSGADAILIGAELVRAGVAPVCVCGGVDVLTLSKRLAHSALATMSPTMLRAFDQRHDGTLLGEGAAFLVLESRERAAERSAPVAAYLRGVGSANDAASMTSPDLSGCGARLAIQRALCDAGLAPGDIGLINAHGSGTPLNDAVERNTFLSIFQDTAGPLIFASKGAFGHSLGATGAIEAIALILALREKIVPPIVGLEQPDPELPFPLPLHEAVPCAARFGLSLTLGFGGFDTCLVFEDPL